MVAGAHGDTGRVPLNAPMEVKAGQCARADAPTHRPKMKDFTVLAISWKHACALRSIVQVRKIQL